MEKKIYCADWIVPVSRPPIQNGAIVVENDRISDVGPRDRIVSNDQVPVEFFPNAVIAPGWVNAHCHLELSYLHNSIHEFRHIVEWIEQLVTMRQQPTDINVIKTAALDQLHQMQKSGTVLVGDITNGPLIEPFDDPAFPERVVFYEILGFRKAKADSILLNAQHHLREVNPQAHIVPHAPYSTSAELIQQIGSLGQATSIHAAESIQEVNFITTAAGPFKEFLEKRNVWDDGFKGKNSSPVSYLKQTGFLNKNTLLVHCVQVDENDIRTIRNSSSSVCICARSNSNLKVGRVPLEHYILSGVPVCIGTDSLASNPDLDMNEEISYIYNNFEIDNPGTLIKMATINGAGALGMAELYGSLESGKMARFNIFSGKKAIESDPESFIVNKTWNQIQCI